MKSKLLQSSLIFTLITWVVFGSTAPWQVLAANSQTATMSLSASPSTVAPGDTFAVTVSMNPGSGNRVAGIDTVINYDSAVLETVSTAAGSAFPSGSIYLPTVGSYTPTVAGKIQIGTSVPFGSTSYVTSSGSVVVITMRVKSTVTAPTTTILNPAFISLGNTAGDCNVMEPQVDATSGNARDLLSADPASLTINIAEATDDLTSVSISPASATLSPNTTQSFTATANLSIGVTYAWSVVGGTISSATGSSTVFTAGSVAGSATVTVTATKGSTTRSATANITIANNTSGMNITGIIPSSERVTNTGTSTAVISGTGFGSSTGTVRFGGTPASITGWTDTAIQAVIPAYNSINDVPVTVTVTRPDGALATVGFTYIGSHQQPMPNNGLPLGGWMALVGGNAGLAYFIRRKFW